MAKDNLYFTIGGKAYPFECEEVTIEQDAYRRFRILDITSDHIVYKDPNDLTWKQEDDKVQIYPANLQAIGKTIEKFYRL
ncbi:hypothetical protein [Olivibacter jilunii]|uniref:hypothetical protein n=1 Tax=Olivibacter jilunii TaxID=985016 RepID=UPI003F189F4F